jgi:hypothetical protein
MIRAINVKPAKDLAHMANSLHSKELAIISHIAKLGTILAI